MKKIIFITAIIVTALTAVVVYADYRVVQSTKTYLYKSIDSIPVNKAGILLGTSKYLKDGGINEFWKNRIDAASMLYKYGKIKFIIISGDNSKSYYNEPGVMKKELVKSGVPDSVIYLDYAGFRTFDSMIRAYKVFGQYSFTVISQEFHNQRAVFIARHYNIHAIGFNAKDVTSYKGFKTKLREKFARVKIFIDLLIEKQPKFLGEKIKIG
jgi:SanA protein